MYLSSCRLYKDTVLLLPFDLDAVLPPPPFFPCLITLARTSSTVLNKVAKVGTLVLFLILEENLSTYYC